MADTKNTEADNQAKVDKLMEQRRQAETDGRPDKVADIDAKLRALGHLAP